MDREVTSVTYLSITLIALSIVIAVVAYTVHVGNEVRTDVLGGIIALEHRASIGTLSSIVGQRRVMPKAAIYFIVHKEHKGITQLDYSRLNSNGTHTNESYTVNSRGMWIDNLSSTPGDGFWFPADIIGGNIDGKVFVDVTPLGNSLFRVSIEEIDLHS